LPKLVERLGYSARDRLLIINCDDLGSSRSANRAIERALRQGVASSATLMVPCPCAEEAARSCGDLDVGIHLTLNSEYPDYRWPSLTGATSLHDAEGYLPKTPQEVLSQASLADVEEECRAQIEQALAWGLDISHLDSHMDILQSDHRFFAIYLKLAKHYRLPLRLRRPGLSTPSSFISRSLMDRAGIAHPDFFIAPPWGRPSRAVLFETIPNLHAGVTEIYLHPVDDGEELRGYDKENADLRSADAECVMDDTIRELIAAQGVVTIGFRPLREMMRHSAGQGASRRPGR
jgi:hypothetical protein